MRCDANVSVRPRGESAFGERTEIKNLNSFRFLERAIETEIERQIDVLESGGRIRRETRLYDPDRNETRAMRGKEQSEDYRYFPDPDLMPVVLEPGYIEAIAATLPELPDARRARYQTALGLTAYDAAWLTEDPDLADYFEVVAGAAGDAKLAANWVMGDLSAALNRANVAITASPVAPQGLAALILRIKDDTLSSKTAKTVFEALWSGADDVDAVIEARGLRQVSDTGALEALVQQVVADNPAQVAQYRAGKDKVFGFFVGQIMKATQGTANPKQLNDLLKAALAGD